MRSPILLLSVLSLLFPSHATNLIEALQLAGAAQFAAQIQSDPAAAAIFFSNQVQTVFAPVDVLTHSSANSSTGRLRRRQSTAASLQQKLYQSTANTNTLGSMSSESGLAMQSNDKSAAGKRQVFVSNPPRNNKCSNVQRRFFLDPEHDDHYFPPVTLTTTLYITTTATELVTVVSTIHDTESLTVPVPTTVHETELVTVAVTIHDSEFVTLPMPTTVTVQDTTFVTVAKTVTNTESVTVPTTVATTVRDTEFVTRPTTVRQSVTESTTVYDTEFATEPTTMATTVRDTEFVTRPTTVRQSVTESTTVYDTKFATESTTVHETEPITSPTTIRETKSVTESTTVDKTESVTVPTTLLTTMVRTEPTTMVVTEFATASPQIPVTVFTTVSTRVYTTVSTIVATRISTTLLPAVTSSVLEISSGLGNLVSIIQGDIPYNGGLIHVVDNYFTLPEGLIDTANANGQTTFTGLVSSNGLARTFDNTPDLTYFIPANSAFAMPGAARAYSSIRDLLLGHAIPNFVGYLPSLTNGSTYKSLAGTTFTVIHDGCDYHVNNAKIILPNVIVGNGVAHVIDKVIEPSSTATAAASPNSAASLWEGSIQHVLMIWSLIISLALGFLI